MKDSLMWISIGAVLLTGLWATYTKVFEGGVDGPRYQTQHQDGAFEVRKYEPFVIAKTAMKSRNRKGMSGGFRVLAGYIFGGNQTAERLAMTAPVVTTRSGESLGMTRPVLKGQNSGTMAFVMPGGRDRSNLPRPDSNQVSLHDVDWGLTASIRFSGYATPERVAGHRQRLMIWIGANGYKALAEPMTAQYNSPGAMPLLRRNEVIVSIERLTNP